MFGIPYYELLNNMIDTLDRVKIRSFDHGQVLVSYDLQVVTEFLVFSLVSRSICRGYPGSYLYANKCV